jgi:hypothetical protein
VAANSAISWDVVLRDHVEVPRRFGRVSKASNQQEASRIMKPLLQCTAIIPEPNKKSNATESSLLCEERGGEGRSEEETRGEERGERRGEERRGNLTTCCMFLV